MESASAPGTADLTFAHGPPEEYSPLTDGYGGFVDIGTLSGGYGQRPRPRLDTESLYGDDLIGVSLSRVQTEMRSPTTPASAKASALNLPLEYFQRILALAEGTDDNIDSERAKDTQPSAPDDCLRPPALFQHHAGSSASPNAIKGRTSWSNSLSSFAQEADYDQEVGQSDLSFDNRSLFQRAEAQERTKSWEYGFPPQPTRHAPRPPPVEVRIPQQARRSGNDVSVLDGTDEGAFTPRSPRTSITKHLLSEAGNERKRSLSSGATTLLANLRKLLPDLPPVHSNRNSLAWLPSSRSNSGQQSPISGQNTPTTRTSRWSMRDPLEGRDTGGPNSSMQPERSTVHDLATGSQSQLDGNVESLLSPMSPASNVSRARSNSESSLYIRRRVSGASAYDDISAFTNVTDMANSRFKAITDSFQNSTLKLPKLPAILPGGKRRMTPEQVNGEASRGFDPVASGLDGRIHNHHYTTVKRLRNAAKGVEMETPQQRAHPVLSHALSKATGDIVVLGGYRGSILRSAKPPHRQLWVPIKVGLNLRKVDLEVGLTREDEERMEQTIIPDGVLSHIGPIDICRRLLKHMHKCQNTRDNKLRVHNWGYDWRLSLDLLSGRLIKFLESLESNHPETPHEKRGAIVVAHSLGGLITRHAVNQRPDLFAGVVYAGVPQHCVNILGPMRNGDDVLLSSRVLTAQVNFTIRTSYALLPEDGHCFIQKHTNQRYDLDFFDPAVWDEYRLSPCINPPLQCSLRDKDDHRKSLMGVLSDSISATSRRSPRSSLGPSNEQASPHPDARESMEELSQRMTDKALEAGQDTEGNAGGMVGPSMSQSEHRPTVATAVTIPSDLALEYLDRTLAEVLVFKKQLAYIPSHQDDNLYPPHAFIFGKTVPTVSGARVANKEAIKYMDAFDDLAFAAGDGVVLASAAQLPEGYRCVKGGRIVSDRGHVGLMGDLEGMGRCIEAVIDGRAKGVGLGKSGIV